jgi:hypothetical protein
VGLSQQPRSSDVLRIANATILHGRPDGTNARPLAGRARGSVTASAGTENARVPCPSSPSGGRGHDEPGLGRALHARAPVNRGLGHGTQRRGNCHAPGLDGAASGVARVGSCLGRAGHPPAAGSRSTTTSVRLSREQLQSAISIASPGDAARQGFFRPVLPRRGARISPDVSVIVRIGSRRPQYPDTVPR